MNLIKMSSSAVFFFTYLRVAVARTGHGVGAIIRTASQTSLQYAGHFPPRQLPLFPLPPLVPLRTEPLDQNGNQQIEQHVIAKGHQGHEIQRRPIGRLRHTVRQHHVPILLRQNLKQILM